MKDDKEVNNQFDAVFQHSHIGIIITNDKGVIEDVNPFAARMFNYSKEELINQKIEVLLPSNIRDRHVGLREGYVRNPEPRSMGVGRDLRALKKGNQEFNVEVSLCSYEFKEERKVVSFINDITDRVHAESSLRELSQELEKKVESRTKELSQALVELGHTNEILKKSESEKTKALQKEVELNEIKSRFVSMASHEFRTPLAGILNSATLIGKYKFEDQQDKRDKHLDIIKRSVKNLTGILQDFLSLDKLEQNLIGAKPIEFVLSDQINEIISDFLDYDDSRKICLEKCIDPSVYQDKEIIRNILINLISNALKYSGREAEVKVFLNEVDSHNLKILVIDQGIGIPKKEQNRLFTKFFRAKNVENIQGTGLGLNIVKRYVDLIKGEISFDSIEGEGTTFKVEFPKRLI